MSFEEKYYSTNRNRAFNRHQRERIIRKKLYILNDIMNIHKEFFSDKNIGKLSKGKVHCSCKMCRYAQHYGLEKFKYEIKLKVLQHEINFYEND